MRMSENLFRKVSLDRISSPEQLNDYIRVSNPGVWLTLGAVVAVLAAVFVWGFFGALPSTVSQNGFARDGVVTCYLETDHAAKVAPGMDARVGGAACTVSSVGAQPLSLEEAGAGYESDYTRYALNLSEWNTQVTIDAPGTPDGLTPVVITLASVRPIDFLLN